MKESSTSIVSSRNKLIWLLLTVLGAVTYLAGYFFPAALKANNQLPHTCPKNVYNSLKYPCDGYNSDSGSIFAFEITNVTQENQFVALQGFLSLKDQSASDFVLNVEVSSYAVSNDYYIQEVHESQAKKNITFVCHSGPSQTANCHPETFAEIVGVDKDHYLFVVKFLNIDDSTADRIGEFKLVITTQNADFSSYLSILKIVLFGLAIIGYAIYRAYLGKITAEMKLSEQTYIGYLGFILVLFNQPFFQYAPSEEGFYFSVYGVVVASAQSALLVLFWFVLVERLASADAVLSSGGKTLIKTLALIHFGASVAGYTVLAQSQSTDPQSDLGGSQNPLVVLYRVYLIGFSALVGVWTVIRLFRIIRKFKEFDWRDSTSFTFSFCYVLCYLFFIMTGGLQATNYKGARVVLLYGVTALYTLLLEVIYVPFEHEIEESEKRRKYETPETNGQFGELDMSDASSPNIKNDNIQLRRADQNQKNQDAEEYDEV